MANDRETCIEILDNNVGNRGEYTLIPSKTAKRACELLKEQQPKKGRWRKSLHLSSQKYYMICTCCQYECQGWDGETGVAYDYCPNCGAEMQNGNTNRDYKEDGEQE